MCKTFYKLERLTETKERIVTLSPSSRSQKRTKRNNSSVPVLVFSFILINNLNTVSHLVFVQFQPSKDRRFTEPL